MKKILIIGGDSFIAGQFINKYVSTDSITCYSRRPTGYEKEIVVKAFRDMPVEAFSGFDAVINFAAIVHRPEVKDQELYDDVNYRMACLLAQKAKQVYGVEIVPAAIEDAKKNAALNKIGNAEFYVGKAEEVLPEKYEKDGVYADVIVVDPPRKGCDETLLSTMLQMKPKRIVYVSCDSATLARDLKILCEENYQLEKVAVCDMFPSSVHVETVACLERK